MFYLRYFLKGRPAKSELFHRDDNFEREEITLQQTLGFTPDLQHLYNTSDILLLDLNISGIILDRSKSFYGEIFEKRRPEIDDKLSDHWE